MNRDPFEQPNDETSRDGDHDPSCCGRDCADCIVDSLVGASITEPDDSTSEPCERRGCRGCDRSPPLALPETDDTPDLGNEPPF